MKKLLVAFVSICAVSSVTAFAVSGASASEWLCKGEKITGTGNNRCLVVSENLGVLKLEDMGVPAAIECPVGTVLDEGWVGPGAEDEITLVEFMEASTKCTPSAKALDKNGEELANGCEKVEAFAAVDLPWKTKIEEESSAGNWWDLISEQGTGGQPGYALTCKVAGVKVTDTCTSTATTDVLVLLENLAAEGAEPELVTMIFNENPLEANQATKCAVGGAEVGLVIGEELQAAVSSTGALEALSVS